MLLVSMFFCVVVMFKGGCWCFFRLFDMLHILQVAFQLIHLI